MVNITVVGSFVVGVTVRVPRMPVPGEVIIGDLFDMGSGGKGTNQAIAASRLGANVKLIAVLGDDSLAEVGREVYRKEGIDTGYIYYEKDINTGFGFVTLLESGDNCIVGHLGANMRMGSGHVDRAEEAIAKSDIVLTQFEVPLEAVSRAMELGRKHGAMTIWNPAPAKKVPADLLANVDIITPNETEARILAGLDPDDPISMDLLADRLAALGVRTVIVTLGKKGAFIIQDKERERIPAPVVEALDPTGAGDTFNAALAVGLGDGLSLKDAVRQANHAAAYCVRHLGVIGGLPKKAELEEFIATLQ